MQEFLRASKNSSACGFVIYMFVEPLCGADDRLSNSAPVIRLGALHWDHAIPVELSI